MGRVAGVSLPLAALGLYRMLGYSVRQRTREIGVRIALGATAAQIRQLILRQTTLFLRAGLVAGIGGSLALGGFLKSLVFGISPTNPRILAVTAVSLIATALLAAWLPMRRAARMDPMVALRGE
jgi:putative ABC transport system permease protein